MYRRKDVVILISSNENLEEFNCDTNAMSAKFYTPSNCLTSSKRDENLSLAFKGESYKNQISNRKLNTILDWFKTF